MLKWFYNLNKIKTMTNESNQPREYYGPPRKLNDKPRSEESIRSHRGMPGGKSYADNLTDAYGEEGKGWEFATDTYATRNELESVDAGMRHKLAREALNNMQDGFGRVTNDGVPLSSRQIDDYSRTAHPPDGDILVYPDGDQHNAHREEDK